nr:MAG TPA: hypothetical protein [Caudoviricetes sp.]
MVSVLYKVLNSLKALTTSGRTSTSAFEGRSFFVTLSIKFTRHFTTFALSSSLIILLTPLWLFPCNVVSV